MRKRIIICAQKRFPRGDAGANRVLYMAKAMKEYGFDVIVISTGLENARKFNGKLSEYSGIKYINIRRLNGKLGRLYGFFNSGRNTVKVMKELNVNRDDTVIIYSSFGQYIAPVWNFLKRKGISTYFDVVERQQEFQYDNKKLWRLYEKGFAFYHKSGKIIAISENIRDYFLKKGCSDAPVLPIFTDKEDYDAVIKTKTDKTVFIYPGNAYKKDDMKTMISAFAALSDEQKQRVEFHVTSTKESTIRKILGEEYDELTKKTKGCVFIHSWLEYEELLALYQKAQFLLLARPDNIVTRANFPSKVPELTVTGTIPVISKVGDIVNYLTDGVDSIFMESPTTVEICNQAIIRAMELSEEEVKSMSINARKTAEDKFDYRNWVDEVGKIFG